MLEVLRVNLEKGNYVFLPIKQLDKRKASLF